MSRLIVVFILPCVQMSDYCVVHLKQGNICQLHLNKKGKTNKQKIDPISLSHSWCLQYYSKHSWTPTHLATGVRNPKLRASVSSSRVNAHWLKPLMAIPSQPVIG